MEQNWCDYSCLLPPKIIAHRFEDNRGHRFYWFLDDDGELHISIGVTSAFGEVSTERRQIDKWKEIHPNWKQLLSNSSSYGTELHKCFGKLSLGKSVDEMSLDLMRKIATDCEQSYDMPVKDILSFKRFIADIKLIPLINEGILTWRDEVSGEYLAMTIDLLAKVKIIEKRKELVQEGFYKIGDKKGEPKLVEKMVEYEIEKTILVDYKSNFFEKDSKSYYEGHKMQLMAAKKAVEQNYPDIKVEELYNFSPNAWRSEPSYTFYKWDITPKDELIFQSYWNLIVVKDINKPTGKILEAQLDEGTFRQYTYEEYVREVLLKDNGIDVLFTNN